MMLYSCTHVATVRVKGLNLLTTEQEIHEHHSAECRKDCNTADTYIIVYRLNEEQTATDHRQKQTSQQISNSQHVSSLPYTFSLFHPPLPVTGKGGWKREKVWGREGGWGRDRKR